MSGCTAAENSQAADAQPAEAPAQSSADTVTAWLTPERRAEEDSIFRAAAKVAFDFIDRNYVPATGLTKPFPSYDVSTVWDIASGLAALFCATELGLLDRAEYDRRMRRALLTLEQLPLFDNVSFNKEYVVTTGELIGIERTPSSRGYGVSVTDTGRLLLWLRILANRHEQHAPAIRRVVSRLQLSELVEDGYLEGRQLSRRTGRTREFQEGRLGYEQYAARGYEVWGVAAENALDIGKNMETRDVLGVAIPKDRRGNDRLTSEPFILLGIEAGWAPGEGDVARRLLAVQEERYRQTGTLTLVSEDALNIEPHYFFYYTILSRHGPWSIDVQRGGPRLEGPRWVSTKAAFAWHALLPGPYTRMILDTVRSRALVRGVWGAGVFESGRPTGNPNINTAAVILEAALYRVAGGTTPLLNSPEARVSH